MTSHRIGTREEWLAASAELLRSEKEITRTSDELARQRRELPWLPVEKEYTLQTADGAGRSRSCLMAARSWWSTTSCSALSTMPDASSCSSTADSFNGVLPHSRPAT